MIIDADVKEVGTFTAYHRGYYTKDNAIIFPYINVHVGEDFPLNPTKTITHLNYVYFVLFGVDVLRANDKIYGEHDPLNDSSLLVLEGQNLVTLANTYYVLKYKRGYLDVPNDYKFSKNGDAYFLPINSKHIGEANLDPLRVENFFNNLPEIK